MTTVVSPGKGAGSGELAEATSSNSSLRRFLHGLPGVDQVGAEARAAMLGTRSIKTTAKEFAIDLAIRMVDLTTLEGADTPGKVRALCAKAARPDPSDASVPRIERFIVVVVDEPTIKLSALVAGELDFAGINPQHAAFATRAEPDIQPYFFGEVSRAEALGFKREDRPAAFAGRSKWICL